MDLSENGKHEMDHVALGKQIIGHEEVNLRYLRPITSTLLSVTIDLVVVLCAR